MHAAGFAVTSGPDLRGGLGSCSGASTTKGLPQKTVKIITQGNIKILLN